MMRPRSHRFAVVGLLCGLAAGVPGQQPAPGSWDRSDVPDGWVLFESRHYQIQSQAGWDKAERLADHMESMLLVYRKLFRGGPSSFKRHTIKLFRDRRSYLAYGAPANSAAYYSQAEHELVAYDTGKWMDDPRTEPPLTADATPEMRRERLQSRLRDLAVMDTLGNAAHEGWHQYFHWYVTSWVELPSWINEGLGDYFYCARPVAAKRRHEMPAELGALNESRLPTVWTALQQGTLVPLADLIHYEKRQYYANPAVCYSEGWALCHFLLTSGNKRYEQVIEKFVLYVRDDTNMEKVTEKAFRGVDLDQLQREWEAWIAGDAIEQLRQKIESDTGVRVMTPTEAQAATTASAEADRSDSN